MIARHEQPTPGPAALRAAEFQALVPVLTTGRLVLRAPTLADFPDYAEIVCGARGKHLGGPMSREDGWYDFVSYISTWALHGHGMWTVFRHRDDARLGFVALGLEPGDREVELGYLFVESAEGHGFAREAVRAVRDWAFRTLKLPTLVSYIDSNNTRSIRLCEAIGAFEDTPADWDPEDVVYRHRNPEPLQ